MKLRKTILWSAGGALVVVGLIGASTATYTLDEAEQAVVLQFGKPIGDPITTPGLHFKLPFVQQVRVFEERRLVWDGAPNQVPTRGREFISVDTTARWRIVDALTFLKSVGDEKSAQSRLDDIIDSVVRDKISSTELVEIVRSASWEVDTDDLPGDMPVAEGEDAQLQREIQIGRPALARSILEAARKTTPRYGIDLVDVRIKRLNYIPSVRKRVFDRMISERQRVAEEFRSEGEGEASRIRGRTERELRGIRSGAERKAEVLRGKADAEAAAIYNEAYGRSPGFYRFWRSMQTWRTTLPGSLLLMESDQGPLRYLQGGGQPVPETRGGGDD